MKISVAMTTYNGEKYIEKQLDSLRVQTLPADEVFISDDGSTDNTLKVVNQFIEKWKLLNWHLYENPAHKGWIYNFHQCIAKTQGDIVFFCDQDDIWDCEKIKIMSEIMQSQQIDALSCDISMINSNDEYIYKKQEALNKKEVGNLTCEKLNKKYIYSIFPGCSMCVSRKLIDRLSLIDESITLPHDALYWKTALAMGTAYHTHTPLIKYRIHDSNASNPSASLNHHIKSVEVRDEEINITIDQLKKFSNIYKKLSINNDFIDELIRFEHYRSEFINKKMKNILCYFVKNIRFYQSFNMFLGDLLCRWEGK